MNISRYIKIALFFIVLGGAGSVYIIVSADGLSDFNTRLYEVTLSDATGLSTRSKIYLAGVAVGRVREITLGENEAKLKVAFLKNIQIREDAKLARKSSSILGTSVLALDPGTEPSPVMPPGSQINSSKEVGDIGAVMGTVKDLGAQISELLREFQENQLAMLSVSLATFNSIAEKINSESDAELERVSRILESVALIAERTERMMAQAENNDTGPAADIYTALENIRLITDEIRRGQGNMGQVIYDDQLYASILSTAQRIEVAALKLQTTLDTINAAASSAGEVIVSAGEIVDRAAGLGIQVDTSASYHLMANQLQAGAAIRLHPASDDRWYRIGVSSIPGGIAANSVEETRNPDGSLQSTTTKRSTFAVDAEIARRFGFLTFRGGLLENTAGLGLDIQPVRWASISGEVFDFKSGETPNLRNTLTLYPFFDPASDKPWNWIYLKGGVNNTLSVDRSYFIGGGVRFADREIKGLVGLASTLTK
jgi:phospholipid/cholesterol/gamma-HCH transport system substrate-binding protein